jgi:hypothetical protein
VSKTPNEHQIRSVYDEVAAFKSDERAMFHQTNNLNLQSEIFRNLGYHSLAHGSSSCIDVGTSSLLALPKPTSSI